MIYLPKGVIEIRKKPFLAVIQFVTSKKIYSLYSFGIHPGSLAFNQKQCRELQTILQSIHKINDQKQKLEIDIEYIFKIVKQYDPVHLIDCKIKRGVKFGIDVVFDNRVYIIKQIRDYDMSVEKNMISREIYIFI